MRGDIAGVNMHVRFIHGKHLWGNCLDCASRSEQLITCEALVRKAYFRSKHDRVLL